MTNPLRYGKIRHNQREIRMMKIKTKKLIAGDYVTTNTNTTYCISKSYDGSNTWTLCDESYDKGMYDGHFSIWDTKKDCLEIVAEKERGA